MNRKIFSELKSKEKIELKKYFYGVCSIPKLLKFNIFNKEIYWKNVKLIKEHCILDKRLNFLLNLQNKNIDGTYWTDGNSIFNLNNLDFDKLKINQIKFNKLNNLDLSNNLLLFKKDSKLFSHWRNSSIKKDSDIISNFLLNTLISNINPLEIKVFDTNEQTILMIIFNNIKLDDSNLINLKFEPFEFCDIDKLPLFLKNLFKNKFFKALILGVYLKILTKPTEENLILLECLNIKINKLSLINKKIC